MACPQASTPTEAVDRVGPGAPFSLLIETRRFAIKVKLNEQSDPWLPFGDPMDDFFTAAARAVRLIEDQNPPASVKVVAVS